MQIFIDDSHLVQLLSRAANRLHDTTPLMRSISLSLLDDVEQNFAAEGRPGWQGLEPEYKKRRPPTPILQITGQLAASVTPFSGRDFAGVSSNKEYAAAQHFPRNFMPMRNDGSLQPEAKAGVLDVIEVYLKQSF